MFILADITIRTVMQEISAIDILSVVRDAGPTGVLSVAVWAFLTGKIIPAKTVDEIIGSERKATELIATKEFQAAVKEAVKAGFIEAMSERDKASRNGNKVICDYQG